MDLKAYLKLEEDLDAQPQDKDVKKKKELNLKNITKT